MTLADNATASYPYLTPSGFDMSTSITPSTEPNTMPSSVNYWWEIQVLGHPLLEESFFWRLQKFGCQGMASERKGEDLLIRAYLPAERVAWLDLSALALWLREDAIAAELDVPLTNVAVINEEDWSSSWKKHWHPQEIGDLLIIYPAWEEVPAEGVGDRHILRLDPGSAFGTGTHATTQLCLEALEMRLYGVTPEQHVSVADIGCGSGILSIGALMLGAEMIYAVDTDILAIKATHHNRRLNQLPEEQLWVAEGGIDRLLERLPEPVHGFVCNILAETIMELIPKFEKVVRPEGWGILSGILLEQVPMVAEVLDRHHWVVATLWKRQDWACLTIRRP